VSEPPALTVIDSLSDASLADTSPLTAPDRRDGLIYVHDDHVRLAIKVALVTGRPLLLRGEPGSGKSSLAAYVARNLGWRYYEHVFTTRSRGQDLLWAFDAVRKLADAQHRPAARLDDHDYVEPGVLWQALDPASARRRGRPPAGDEREPVADDLHDLNRDRSHKHAVVLLDEIDKADPDVPNALLVALGSSQFEVTETRTVVRLPSLPIDTDHGISRLLVVITTNEERELPEAFLRRCIVHVLPHPDHERLVEIAKRHLAANGIRLDVSTERICHTVATKVIALRAAARERGRRPPSTAEYLDAVRTCRSLSITVDGSLWREVEQLTLAKDQSPEDDL
jgi:MoxR-like ATPase